MIICFQFSNLFLEHSKSTLKDNEISTCFTPPSGCSNLIIKHINNSKNEIIIASYSFTSKRIAESIKKALNRGVKITLIVDKSQLDNQYFSFRNFHHVNLFIIVPSNIKGIFHNKIIIIDKEILITGSYNWTNAAEYNNAENVLFIKNKDVLKQYQKYIQNFF